MKKNCLARSPLNLPLFLWLSFPPSHKHTTLISRPRSFSTFLPLFSPFSFQPALSTIVPHAPPSINRTHVHTHTPLAPFKQASRSSYFSAISHPLILATGFIYYADKIARPLSSFYRSTRPASSNALNFFPTTVHHNRRFFIHRMMDEEKRKIADQSNCVYLHHDKNLPKQID